MAKFFRDSAFNQQSFGAAGFDVVKVKGQDNGDNTVDSTTYSEGWVSISATDKSIILKATTATGDQLTADGQAAGSYFVLAPGQTVFGDFTSITVPDAGTSGQSASTRIIAYRRAKG